MNNRNEYLQVLTKKISQITLSHPLRVAIDGIDAAGKTSLADELKTSLSCSGRNVIRASIDGFHQPQEIRYGLGKMSPEGYFLHSFNLKSLIENLLAPLGPAGSRDYCSAVFDFKNNQHLKQKILHAGEKDILLFDGVFLQKEELKSYWDFVIFVDISFETGLKRALSRDLYLFGEEEMIRECYAKRYYPAQLIYFKTCSPKSSADIVLNNNDPENLKIVTEKE